MAHGRVNGKHRVGGIDDGTQRTRGEAKQFYKRIAFDGFFGGEFGLFANEAGMQLA
jgi:hypothetical protein